MRLSEIYGILRQIDTKKARLQFKQPDANSTTVRVSNIINFKAILSILRKIPFYNDQILFFHNSELFLTDYDDLDINTKSAWNIRAKETEIFISVKSLTDALENLGTISVDVNEDVIFIKLPETNNLKDMVEYLANVEKSISQVIYNDTINGNLQIKRWEGGSLWVELMLGGHAAVFLIASIAWAAAVIRKKMYEGDLMMQQARSLDIKNETLEDLKKKQKKATEILIEQEARHIQKNIFEGEEEANGETLQRLKLTTKIFSELIFKGAEIHPSLMAPENVQNLFPNFKQLDTVVSKIKLLEDTPPESE